jgi:transposase
MYIDAPIRGNRVMIEIKRKRYRCKSCGKTIYEPLPDFHEKRLATKRLVKYVQERVIKQTFASLAVEVGMDEKSIRHIFDDHINSLCQNVRFETPEILGIDDVKCSGSFRCILTNIEKLSVFDLLPSCDQEKLSQHFSMLADKHNVKVITMDLSRTFRQVAQEHFPRRIIIADRFHVTKMANDALEKVRRKLWRHLGKETKTALKHDRHKLKSRRNTLSPEHAINLESVLSCMPELKTAYEAKEQFFDLYEHPSRQHAEVAAANWLSQLAPSIQADFKPCIAAITGWNKEIFNYYECKVTNAYTESANRLINDIERAGRGYDFEVIRAKLLYNEKSRRNTQQSIRRKVRQEISTHSLIGSFTKPQKMYETVFIEQAVEFGPHIPTLIELIDDGQIG